jgi:ArsR family transcriptional regulator, arsenate/arsenite/antimonite-responsive transcriptional repressor
MRIVAYSGDVLMQEFTKLFKALSDETRLRMLNILVQRECCVCEVMQVLNISQSRASRNLNILENAGFLKSHHEGVWVHYALNDDLASNFALSLAKMTGEISNSSPLFRKDKARLKRVIRMGNDCTEKPRKRWRKVKRVD